jgi:hypothetical protein
MEDRRRALKKTYLCSPHIGGKEMKYVQETLSKY